MADELVIQALKGIETRMGTLESNVRADINKLHNKLDERDKVGCGFGRVLFQRVSQNRACINLLKKRPTATLNRVVAWCSIAATFIALAALLVGLTGPASERNTPPHLEITQQP